jgi:hypothetical protein
MVCTLRTENKHHKHHICCRCTECCCNAYNQTVSAIGSCSPLESTNAKLCQQQAAFEKAKSGDYTELQTVFEVWGAQMCERLHVHLASHTGLLFCTSAFLPKDR